jgi:VanZ family protein
LITDKNDKINKIILKNMNKILILGFHTINLILIIFYLYPRSLLGLLLYDDSSIQPQITKDFLISSNHFYLFIVLSVMGILAYHNTRRIYFLVNYLFFLSIIIELFHMFIPNRSFEVSDLFGNIMGVVVVFVFYKIQQKYE